MISLKISYGGPIQMTMGFCPSRSFIYSFIYSSIKYLVSTCYVLCTGCAMAHKLAVILELMERVLVESTGCKK